MTTGIRAIPVIRSRNFGDKYILGYLPTVDGPFRVRVVPKGCRVFGHDASAAFYCSTSVPGASSQAATNATYFALFQRRE